MKKMKHFKNLLLAAFMLATFGLSAQFAPFGPHLVNNNNPGFVGIGTVATPTVLLDVNRFMTEPTIAVRNTGSNGGATFQMISFASGADWKFKATNTGGFKIRDHASGLDPFVIEQNSAANSIYIDAAGDIAFGHNAPNGHQLNATSYTIGKAAVFGESRNGTFVYATGMLGLLDPAAMGAPIPVASGLYNAAVMGIAPNNGSSSASIFGWNNDDTNRNYAGLFMSDGPATNSGYINYGVYADAQGADINLAGNFVGRVEITGHPDAATAADYDQTVLAVQSNHSGTTDTYAIHGASNPSDGNGYGVVGTGGYRGVSGTANAGTGTYAYGVYGAAYGSAGSGRMIGVFGYASGGSTNWAGYFSGDAYISSDLRIGTLSQATGYSLSVDGKIACEEVLVQNSVSWPDYVFTDEYELMDLKELEKSIEENNHLPGLPAAAEVEENGFELADMQRRVLEKVEELTLYTIEQGKLIEELQNKVETLEKENNKLKRANK